MPPGATVGSALLLAALVVGPAVVRTAVAHAGDADDVAADEVILKDGTSIRGRVVEEGPDVVRVAVLRGGDRVVVELPRGRVHWVRRLGEAAARIERDAEAALVAGDLGAAVAALRSLVAARPDDPRAHRELGFALILQGAHADAVAHLERACAIDPIDFEAHLQLAQALEALGRPDEAIARYRCAAGLGPRHVVAWRGLARLLLARGGPRDRAEALDALARATREAPDDEALLLERVDALLAAPDGDRAGEARAILQEHVARRPASARAGRRLARLLALAGEPGRARDQAAALAGCEAAPADARERARAEAALYAWIATGAPGLAPAGLDAGDDAVDLDAAARALDLLLEAPAGEGPAVEDEVLLARLLLARARVDVRAARLDEASRRLDRAAVEASLLPGAGDVLADVLLLQEVVAALRREPGLRALFGPDVAAAKARRAAALVPWLVAAHETLARALEREGAFDEAALAWTRGAARAPDVDERRRLEQAAAAAREAHARGRRNRGL